MLMEAHENEGEEVGSGLQRREKMKRERNEIDIYMLFLKFKVKVNSTHACISLVDGL